MNGTLHRFAAVAAQLRTLPTLLLYRAQTPAIGRDLAFQRLSERAALWPGTGGVLMRRALYKAVLEEVGDKLVVSLGTVMCRPSARFGDRVYIGSYCSFGDVSVGSEVLFSDFVSVPSGARQHGTSRLDIPMRDQQGQYATVHVGNDCWIGAGAVVMADVGNHCIVGAGAIVTKPVDDYHIVVGNPARVIGDRRERTVRGEGG